MFKRLSIYLDKNVDLNQNLFLFTLPPMLIIVLCRLLLWGFALFELEALFDGLPGSNIYAV